MSLDTLAKVLRRALRRGDMRIVDACASAILHRGARPWRRAAAFAWLAHAAYLRRSIVLGRGLGGWSADHEASLFAGHRRAMGRHAALGRGTPLP